MGIKHKKAALKIWGAVQTGESVDVKPKSMFSPKPRYHPAIFSWDQANSEGRETRKGY